jgi:hypothetical protein
VLNNLLDFNQEVKMSRMSELVERCKKFNLKRVPYLHPEVNNVICNAYISFALEMYDLMFDDFQVDGDPSQFESLLDEESIKIVQNVDNTLMNLASNKFDLLKIIEDSISIMPDSIKDEQIKLKNEYDQKSK